MDELLTYLGERVLTLPEKKQYLLGFQYVRMAGEVLYKHASTPRDSNNFIKHSVLSCSQQNVSVSLNPACYLSPLLTWFSALSDPHNQWSYCPSLPAAFIFAVLFLVSTLGHIYQAFRHRKLFCLVIITGGLWETAAFAFRVLSARHPTHKAS